MDNIRRQLDANNRDPSSVKTFPLVTVITGGTDEEAHATGGPTTVAGELERWADEADVDGFNLAYAIAPGTFEDLVDHVVPELQKRGRAAGNKDSTLRGNLLGQPRLRDDQPGARYRHA